MRHVKTNTTTAPKNPAKYVRESTVDVLNDPQWSGAAKPEVHPTMEALEKALLDGDLMPSDCSKVCACLSLGRPLPLDLAARVASAPAPKTKT
ncbi:hypothetical protein C0Z16_04745 [Paraburkholderia rhynchosiae]|nr:hypothetical protein C0Z16_04745 [Paraburkholderia rhynchosiae]